MKTGFRCYQCGSRSTRVRTDGARRAREVNGMVVRVHQCAQCNFSFVTVQRNPTPDEIEAILEGRA